MDYFETSKACEDLVRMGILDVRRGSTAKEDRYSFSEFGKWIDESGLFYEFNHANACQRQKLRSLYFGARKKGK